MRTCCLTRSSEFAFEFDIVLAAIDPPFACDSCSPAACDFVRQATTAFAAVGIASSAFDMEKKMKALCHCETCENCICNECKQCEELKQVMMKSLNDAIWDSLNTK